MSGTEQAWPAGRFIAVLAVVTAFAACSGETPTNPTATAAAIVARAPASVAARTCAGCGAGASDLEAVVDLIVEETAGVAGQITTIEVLLRTGSVVIAGPGQFDAAAVTQFGGGTNRVPARGSLTLRSIGVHFASVFRPQLPATLTFNIHFRDDRGNSAMSNLVAVAVTP
jgi:hypothetical protein